MRSEPTKNENFEAEYEKMKSNITNARHIMGIGALLSGGVFVVLLITSVAIGSWIGAFISGLCCAIYAISFIGMGNVETLFEAADKLIESNNRYVKIYQDLNKSYMDEVDELKYKLSMVDSDTMEKINTIYDNLANERARMEHETYIDRDLARKESYKQARIDAALSKYKKCVRNEQLYIAAPPTCELGNKFRQQNLAERDKALAELIASK